MRRHGGTLAAARAISSAWSTAYQVVDLQLVFQSPSQMLTKRTSSPVRTSVPRGQLGRVGWLQRRISTEGGAEGVEDLWAEGDEKWEDDEEDTWLQERPRGSSSRSSRSR
jgi:hypothetical protein